jgi:uncharacterized heparinase superfamily protein
MPAQSKPMTWRSSRTAHSAPCALKMLSGEPHYIVSYQICAGGTAKKSWRMSL